MSMVLSNDSKDFLQQNSHLIGIFLHEVLGIADTVNKHISEFNKQVNESQFDQHLFWSSLYGVLHGIAQVSLIFQPSNVSFAFPQETKERFAKRKILSKKRGQCLCELFALSGKEAFLVRNFRNRFVHMDEALDDWWLGSNSHNMARRIIGPLNIIDGFGANEMFEHYVPEEKKLIFRGEELDFNAIVGSFVEIIKAIHNKASTLEKFNIRLNLK